MFPTYCWSHNNLFGPVFVFIQELGCLLQVTVSLICFSMMITEIEQKRSGYGDRFVVWTCSFKCCHNRWFWHIRILFTIIRCSIFWCLFPIFLARTPFDLSFVVFFNSKKKSCFFLSLFYSFSQLWLSFCCLFLYSYLCFACLRLIDFELKACKMLACWSFKI